MESKWSAISTIFIVLILVGSCHFEGASKTIRFTSCIEAIKDVEKCQAAIK